MNVRLRLLFIADANATNASVWLSYFGHELGHDVHVIAMRPLRRRTIDGVTIHDLGTKSKLGYFARIPQIRSLVRAIQPDLVIGYRVQSYGFLAACTGFRPLALAGQCDTIAWPPDSRVSRAFCRYALTRADLISSWSEIMTANLVRLGARSEIIFTFPRGVKTDVFFPASAEAPAPRTIITTRGLTPEYHQEAVIRSLRTVRDRLGEPLRYLVLGEGPTKETLERLSVDLGVQESVSFLGLVPHDQVPVHLRRAHVYVSLVSTEGVSASLLEAMACGVFPIVPDIPANRLWIDDGRNGFLVPMEGWRRDSVRGFLAPPIDDSRLADRIVTALEDGSLRQKARDINVELVRQKACWATNMGRMERAYADIVQRWRRRHGQIRSTQVESGDQKEVADLSVP